MSSIGNSFETPIWPGVSHPSLTLTPLGPREAWDLTVVGGGILGLCTALSAVRQGLSVRLIEAGRIGQGASSVNGGQVIPGLKYDPDWLLAHFGPERGRKLVEFAASTADRVFDLIDREGLAVPAVRNGWIQAAVTGKALVAGHRRAGIWASLGADTEALDAGAIRELTGARGYLGGWLDRRAGTIDPRAYVQELARIASEKGVALAEQARAAELVRQDSDWVTVTEHGERITSRHVVVATNAQSDGLVPGLARSLVPLHSFQIATAPLPAEVLAGVLPGGQAVSDSRRILVYYRRGPGGRLVLGGRGQMSVPTEASHWAHLERAMLRLYPSLKGIPIERRWYGKLAVTPDHLPHLHRPEPGLIAFAGCQGRGVALMTSVGLSLGAALAAGNLEDLPFPIRPIQPIPFHGLRRIGVSAAITGYRTMDALGI